MSNDSSTVNVEASTDSKVKFCFAILTGQEAELELDDVPASFAKTPHITGSFGLV